MTCKICAAAIAPAETGEPPECCGAACQRELTCRRIAWDRAAKMVAVNGYYHRRHAEHLRNNNRRGATVMMKEWIAAKAGLGERP